MKKKIVSALLATLILFSCMTSAYALSARALSIRPSLTFGTNTVLCKVSIGADTGESILATISLFEGDSCIRTWTRSSNGYLIFSEYVPVISGYKYTLTVDSVINGIQKPIASVDGTYVQ